MTQPVAHIETLYPPARYPYEQIKQACLIAAHMDRGKLVLVEPPRKP